MQQINPDVLLVGEAPGYKGCKLSGIPFTSEYHILNVDFFKEGFGVLDPDNIDKEVSACAIWKVLDGKRKIPLMWNIYPFHPLTPDGRNGKPKCNDIKLGKEILDKLLTMFNIERIYGVGKKSSNALAKHPLFRGYIRHPSYGGINECIKRLEEILL